MTNNNDKKTKVTEERHAALTEIGHSFQSNETSQGFATAKQSADRALAENRQILNNRFVLKSALGAGGMGTVYKAEDLRKVEARDTNIYVATKILNADFKNHPDAYISLQREASRSHLLSHPNIVTVHDFDRDGDTIYMTMELLQGEDLESLIKKHEGKGVPKDKALKILKDICTALIYAHGKGIIHSDLKPGNIFVTEEGTKVLDFGIARLAKTAKFQDHFDAGRIGAITPAYASLEMIGRKPPHAKDDLFAVAIIAYELLTGTHPYNNKSAGVALAKGMKPKEIEGLSKRQWHALKTALALKSEDRDTDVASFLEAMTVKPKLPLLKLVSISLVVVTSWFAYVKFFAPNELTQEIEETLTKAQTCMLSQDYLCASDSAKAVLEMDEGNEQAGALLENANRLAHKQEVNGLVQEIDGCLANEQVECALSGLNKLVDAQPSSQVLNEVNEKIDSMRDKLQIRQWQKESQSCMANQDFACVIERANSILSLDNAHQPAKELKQKADQKLAERNLNLKQLVKEAKSCLRQHQYECAKTNAQKALSIAPNSEEASELFSDAEVGIKQQKDNKTKAEKMLKDGRKCLKMLNYSCAQAKSESALDLIPNYKSALKLKRDTERALKNVKKQIQIE